MAARGRSRVKQKASVLYRWWKTEGRKWEREGGWRECGGGGEKVSLGKQEEQRFLGHGGLELPPPCSSEADSLSPSPDTPPPSSCQIPSLPHLVPLLSCWQHLDPQRARSGRKAVSEWLMVPACGNTGMTFNGFVCSAGLTATRPAALRVNGKPMASTLVLPVLKIHLQCHRPQEASPGGHGISHSSEPQCCAALWGRPWSSQQDPGWPVG